MPCAGLKPGETLNNRATKFQGIGFGVVYKNGAPTHDTQYKSVGQETSVAHGDYRVPNRLGVMAHRVEKYKPRPAKFLGTSTSASTHVDFNADDRALANVTDCTNCAAGSYNHLQAQTACFPCGSSATSATWPL